ncbi:MAG: leucine-rich repeat domain-containing protein [Ruminococcus sp.]|nr:leucine-rich repeat domain-containing protein [Ruminococcus sp.]
MKKFLSLSLFVCAAAMAMTSCNEVGTTSESEPSSQQETQAETTTDIYIPEDEMPTDRVPDIQSSDEFEYEIINGEAVIEGYTGSSSEVEVPAEIGGAPVTKIGTYAFEAEYDITSITLPDTITLIGEGAFMDCGSLETINIPEAVTGIDRGAFVACVSLTEITIPAACQYVREEAFTACESMTTLTIENPELAYESWGLEELPELTISAPEGSSVAAWAEGMGKLG